MSLKTKQKPSAAAAAPRVLEAYGFLAFRTPAVKRSSRRKRRDGSKSTPRELLLSHLPAELLEGVCSHLDEASDLKATSLVCRALRIESQKRLFDRIVLHLDDDFDTSRNAASWNEVTQLLDDKIEAYLARPPSVKSLTIVTEDEMPRNPSCRADVVPKRLALLERFLQEIRTNLDIVCLRFGNRSRAWSKPVISMLLASKHRPMCLELDHCPLACVSADHLQSLLDKWASCTSVRVGLHEVEDEKYQEPLWHLPLAQFPSATRYVAFFQKEQAHLRTASFVTHSYWWEFLSPSFMSGMRCLQTIPEACSSFVRLFKKASEAQVDILVQEVDLLPTLEPMYASNTSILELLRVCPCLRSARIAVELTNPDDEFEFTSLPPRLEHLCLIDTGTDGCPCDIEMGKLARWLYDRAASARLQTLQLLGVPWHLQQDEHRSSLQSCHSASVEYAGVAVYDEAVRYPWDPESPRLEESELVAALVQEEMREDFGETRNLIAWARTIMRQRGIRYVLDMPFQDVPGSQLVQPTLEGFLNFDMKAQDEVLCRQSLRPRETPGWSGRSDTSSLLCRICGTARAGETLQSSCRA